LGEGEEPEASGDGPSDLRLHAKIANSVPPSESTDQKSIRFITPPFLTRSSLIGLIQINRGASTHAPAMQRIEDGVLVMGG